MSMRTSIGTVGSPASRTRRSGATRPAGGKRRPIPRRESAAGSILHHVWIPRLPRRDEVFLDRASARPANQVQQAAGFVIRSARAAAAERLLSDHRTGLIVVLFTVPGCRLEARIHP